MRNIVLSGKIRGAERERILRSQKESIVARERRIFDFRSPKAAGGGIAAGPLLCGLLIDVPV